jgi:hypothetical protein
MKFLMYTYIDDMIIAPRQKNELQRAFHKLTKSVEQNNHTLHKGKTQCKTTDHLKITTMLFVRRSHGRECHVMSLRAINIKCSVLFKKS